MTPSPQNKIIHKLFIPQNIFPNTPQNIEIQNFEPPKMGQAYVYMKISEYAHPSLRGFVVSNGHYVFTFDGPKGETNITVTLHSERLK